MKVWLWAAVLTAGVCVSVDVQAACFSCGADLSCIDVSAGGRFCVQAPNVCSVVMACSEGRGGPFHDPIDPGTESTSLTILDDAPTATLGAPMRVMRHAGRGVFGKNVWRSMRSGGSAFAPEPAVITSLISYGDGGEVAFRARSRDGFTLERRRNGRSVRLIVRALGEPDSGSGRVLADSDVGDDDLMVVRVRIDGAPRLLVLQAQALAGFDAQRQSAEWNQAMRGADLMRAAGPPLLTPEAVR
jgi:hypothetical protein